MNRAQESHARGDLASAARGYENVLKLDPRNFDAAYFLAVALYQQGRLERAAEGFAAAARIDPRRFEPHKDRGLVLMRLGRHEAAVESFAAATRLSPNSPELHLNRGIAQRNAGRIAESIESYRAALRLRPGLAEAHNSLANSLSLLGRREEALASYRQAFTVKPGYVEAYVNAAGLLEQLGRPLEAIPLLEKALAADHRHAEAYRTMAVCLAAAARPDQALAAASRAIALDGTSVEGFLTRAGLHDQARREREAMADYDSALALDPRSLSALLGKARLLCHEARYEEAVSLCDLAIAAHPQEAKAYYGIGRALEGRREYSAALKSYGKAAELEPSWLSPLLRQGRVHRLLGQFEESLAIYERAIAHEPASPDAHIGKGDVLRSLRRFEQALESYDLAVSHAPGMPMPYGIRGELKIEMGDAGGALEDFGQTLRILAAGKPASVAMAEDCIRLLSVDKIPGIYATEADLAATREKVETALDVLDRAHEGRAALSAEEVAVSEQAIRQLTGFYLAYHQRNDRDTMAKLSRVSTRLLSLTPTEIPPRPAGRARIRIGIASKRLRNHNGANWAYNWFARLPQSDYDIFTYSFERSPDEMAAKFAALGTHRELTWSRSRPHDLVEAMRGDTLDMLFLTDVGMTPVSRFLSLHRIAPCQFTAWGHPVTTGSAEMDYYLSSDLMEPANGQDHYTETLIRLPNLALYLDEETEEYTSEPASFGLPEGRVLYGCLQSSFKYLPRYDGILPRIAREVPDALFVFLEGPQPYMTDVLRERMNLAFAAEGLDASRHVTFLPRQTSEGFDRLMRAMDVCIDSVGWSGGNTTLRNIGFAVPLATLPGDFMRGRHSSAMFRMIGAEEMIAHSIDDYVDRLVRLGQDSTYRRHCADLFRAGRHRLYRDQSFIDALDAFLKSRPGLS